MVGERAIVRELARARPGEPRRRVIEALVSDLASSMRVSLAGEPPPAAGRQDGPPGRPLSCTECTHWRC